MGEYKFPKGSQWRRWDLHAHTPRDCEWIARPALETDSERREFAQRYVTTATDNGLAVVAITDHNFCRNRDELLIPYLQEAAVPLGLTILPGFEVTVSDCGGTHVLVIFPEDSPLATIDEIVSQLFPPGTPRFLGNSVLPSQRRIEEMNEILVQSELPYLVLFAHADRENGVLGQRGSDLRARLWQEPFVRIAQLSKPPTECIGFVGAVVRGTNSRYARDITYIMASDCRSLDPDVISNERYWLGQRWTWIKADPTFEGLRQIVFEPSQRTRFQEHPPEDKPDFLTIDHVQFLDPSNTFTQHPIPLNPNLTTIIGGKSTGKSLLLSCIARSVDSEQVQKASEVAGTNLYDLGGLDFEVTWSNGDSDKLSDRSSKHRITFLPQMYIHRLVEKENQSSLGDSLLGFLRQNESFDAEYQKLILERDTVMTQLASEMATFASSLSAWRDIEVRVKELGDSSSLRAELDELAQKSEDLRRQSGFTDTETQDYRQAQEGLTASASAHGVVQQLQLSMQEIDDRVPPIVDEATQNLDAVISEVLSAGDLQPGQLDTDHVAKLRDAIADALEEFSKDSATKIEDLTNRTQVATRAVEAARSTLKPFLDKIANQQQLSEIEQSASRLEEALREIRTQEREKQRIEERYWASVRSMEKLVASRFDVQDRLVSLFNDGNYAHISEDTNISAQMGFLHEKFESDFLGCFDLRHPVSRLGNCFDNNSLVWTKETHVGIITGILRKVVESPIAELRLRSGQSQQDALEMLLRDYLSYSFTVNQNGEDILRMFPGKQGLILLEIFLHLSNSEYPILIDQPEDNLDNRTIYSHLVSFIKSRKMRRQIIIVTHNPNLVLGADAEEVIVANQDDQGQGKNAEYRFEYVSGSIECSFADPAALSVLQEQGIREHICAVLEGGTEAFRKREEKYCLPKA